MFFTSEYPGYALANLGSVFFISLLFVLFCSSLLILAAKNRRPSLLIRVLFLYFGALIGSYILAYSSILVFGYLGAFFLGPPLLIFVKGVYLFGLWVGIPLGLLALIILLIQSRRPTISPSNEKKTSGLFKQAFLLAIVLGIIVVLAACAYVYSLPRITFHNLDLTEINNTGTFSEGSVAQIYSRPEFEEYMRSKFPYRHERAGPAKSFSTPEEFERIDSAVWAGVKRSLAFEFLRKLSFCQSRPIFGVIPSCVYFKPSGGTYLIEVRN